MRHFYGRRQRHVSLVALVTLLWVFAPASPAQARRFFRARFEAETLELQKPGELGIDAQAGGMYGDGSGGSRLVMPDLEIGLGITPWLEVDLDGALSVTQLEQQGDRKALAGDPIWLSGRFDLHNWRDSKTGATFGVGLQAGPRFPSIHTPPGVGFGALLLVGGGTRTMHLVANGGALLDRGQNKAIVYGLDWAWEVSDDWSLLGDVAMAHYFGPEPAQMLIDVGCSYKATPQLQLSLLAVIGPTQEGDRLGGLLGARYAFWVWGRERGAEELD